MSDDASDDVSNGESTTTAASAASADASGSESDGAAGGGVTGDGAAVDDGGGGSRSVEVPMRLYKTVTVFATLIAMVAVILGFVALDVATNRARAAAADVDLLLALLGLGSIAFGAFVYAFSTRFSAVGMGKSKDESAEEPDNG